jgi:hypothetical protein
MVSEWAEGPFEGDAVAKSGWARSVAVPMSYEAACTFAPPEAPPVLRQRACCWLRASRPRRRPTRARYAVMRSRGASVRQGGSSDTWSRFGCGQRAFPQQAVTNANCSSRIRLAGDARVVASNLGVQILANAVAAVRENDDDLSG